MTLNALTDLFHRIGRQARKEDNGEQDGEKPASWYDDAYTVRAKAKAEYARHYTESRYYFVWTVIADRIPVQSSVLEIGCGTGQFAHLLQERAVRDYAGFDFSPQAIRLAKERCPALRFTVDDALTSTLLTDPGYDVVVCTEVLEHIPGDETVLSRIRPGVRCLVTVPNFPYVSHVRHFQSAGAVSERYGRFFETHRVDWFLMRPDGDGFFLCDGVRNTLGVGNLVEDPDLLLHPGK